MENGRRKMGGKYGDRRKPFITVAADGAIPLADLSDLRRTMKLGKASHRPNACRCPLCAIKDRTTWIRHGQIVEH
jgi:hypothetical protein